MNGSVKIFIPIILFMASLGSVSWVVIDNLTTIESPSIIDTGIIADKGPGIADSEPPEFTIRESSINDEEMHRRMLAEGLIELPEVVVVPEGQVTREPEPIIEPEPPKMEPTEPVEDEIIPEPEVSSPPEEITEPKNETSDPAQEVTTVKEVVDVITPIGYKFSPKPDYPRPAERKGLEGKVMLRVHVGVDGSVTEARVVESSGHTILDDSALTTVSGLWRFEPATQNGTPVEKWAEIPIIFTLKKTR